MKKRLKMLLAAVICAVIVSLGVVNLAWAASDIDTTKTGSISFALTYKGTAVSGGSLTMYQVAQTETDGQGTHFVFTNGFENCGVDLGTFSDTTLAAQLEAKISASAVSTTKAIGTDGTVSFGNVPVGVYLFVQKEASSGFKTLKSFLVTVPLQVNGTYVYDVDASPKPELVSSSESDKSSDGSTDKSSSASTLPQTGLLMAPVFALAGAGAVLILVGCVLCRVSRKQRDAA